MLQLAHFSSSSLLSLCNPSDTTPAALGTEDYDGNINVELTARAALGRAVAFFDTFPRAHFPPFAASLRIAGPRFSLLDTSHRIELAKFAKG